jgi:hypothetical protein
VNDLFCAVPVKPSSAVAREEARAEPPTHARAYDTADEKLRVVLAAAVDTVGIAIGEAGEGDTGSSADDATHDSARDAETPTPLQCVRR